jgi:endonuclease/exonuclease/phosphatase family metal-dependent hydrolase
VLTWNVWFDELEHAARYRALREAAHALSPDVMCFQEVTPRFLEPLLDEPWVRAAYHCSDGDSGGDTLSPYGVLLLTKYPIKSLSFDPLPSNMHRSLLTARIQVHEKHITVGTVHLESRRHNTGWRERQLNQCMELLRESGQDSILCGDFNFDPGWPENATIASDFLDVWRLLRSADPGYTEDTARNAMLLADKGKDKQVRFDRVLLRSPRRAWHAVDVQLVGTDALAPPHHGLWPSDHFGVLARFETT